MKKVIILMIITLFLTGCTVVRIDTSSIDNTINIILSKNNDLYNKINVGYKYYIPRGVTYIDSSEQNDKLYSNGDNYYLFVDVISYYYQKEFTYEENEDAYYSKSIDINNKKGYIEIVKKDNKYYIQFMYNYAKIEALVDEEAINDTIINITYILSTVKFNDQIIKTMLEDNVFNNDEKPYDIFEPKGDSKTFLDSLDNYDMGEENDEESLIEKKE